MHERTAACVRARSRPRGLRARWVPLLALALVVAWSGTAFAASTYFEKTPAEGSVSTVAMPLVSVKVSDPAGISGGYQLKVDGVSRTPRVQYGSGWVRLYYQQTAPLKNGAHTVYASVFTGAGRTSTTWSFTTRVPPGLGPLTPADGSTTNQRRPTVSAVVSPNGVALASYEMAIDGVPVAASYDPAAKTVSHTPAGDLANDAVHTVSLTVTDATGASASVSWSFEVQVYADMSDTAGCSECHLGYPGAHPMDDCMACHAPDAPEPAYWNMDYAAPHGASYLSVYSCTYCHSSVWPDVPIHVSDLKGLHVTTSDMSGCACHVRSLTVEHNRYTTDAGDPITCVTCHASTDPVVQAAMAAGSTACLSCHEIDMANHGFDPALHTAEIEGEGLSGTWTYVDTTAQVSGVYMNVPYAYSGVVCLNCHTATIAGPSGEHSKPTASTAAAGCDACHPSPRNTFGTWDKTCYACHPQATLHDASSLSAAHSLADPDPSDAGSCGFVSPTNGRRPCHYSDIVQEHNRKINPTVFDPNKVLSVTCEECHTHAATLAALADGWDGTCTDCHDGTALPNHTVEGTARYAQVHALHDNPGGYYDAGYTSSTGTPVQGYNAMDAHGPVRPNPSGGANQTIGCGAPTCHTQAYIGGGWPYGTGPACSECHGPNVAPVQPYQGEYAWYSDTWVDGQTLTTRLTMTLDPITLPAGSSLDFKTFYDIERDWDYGYVEISTNGGASWTRLPGNITTNSNPYGQNLGNGITGSSGGQWVDAHFDLSAYAGQTVRIRFSYLADYYVYGQGWMLDVISVGPAGAPVFYDDVETENPAWTVSLDPATGAGWYRYTP